MRRLVLPTLLLALAACMEGPTETSEPLPANFVPNKPIVDTSITGSFSLSMPAGYSLPITYDYVAPQYYAQIVGGTLIVSPDGSFGRDLLFRRVTNGVTADSATRETGTWSRNAVGAITFSSAERGDYLVGYLNGTYFKNEVVLNLTYKR